MTSGETRLREALHRAGNVPTAPVGLDTLTQRRRRRRVGQWTATCGSALVIGALITWGLSGGSSDAGIARVVPATTSQPTPTPSAYASDKHSGGGVVVIPLTAAVVISGNGTQTVELGAAPVNATNIMINLTCLTPGTFTFADGAALVCAADDLTDKNRSHATSYVLALHPGQHMTIVRAAAGERWRLSATYAHLLIAGGSDSSSGPATLIPASSSPPTPTPTTPSIPLPSCPPPYGCPSPAPASPALSPPPDLTAPPPVTRQTGISDNGPQISSNRWQNVNSWTTRVNTAPYLSGYPLLTVYAGGATIDPALTNPPSLAAVLVITPTDIYRMAHQQEAIGMQGTIYYPSPDPQGQLKAISFSGNLLTLNLVGTAQNYVFNAATNTFQ